jgi:hypothetical protein
VVEGDAAIGRPYVSRDAKPARSYRGSLIDARPLDATTQAIGIVAKRRVGKSYTARRFAEQLLNAGQQVVIVDPKGDWWGIRSSRRREGAWLSGRHPRRRARRRAARERRRRDRREDGRRGARELLLDLSQFRKREVAVFMADFLETLYRLKAKESLRTPLMLIVDEADAIARRSRRTRARSACSAPARTSCAAAASVASAA